MMQTCKQVLVGSLFLAALFSGCLDSATEPAKPPTVEILAPKKGETFADSVLVDLLIEPDKGVRIRGVAVLIGEDTAAILQKEPWTTYVRVNNKIDGEYPIRVAVLDETGNRVLSDSIMIKVSKQFQVNLNSSLPTTAILFAGGTITTVPPGGAKTLIFPSTPDSLEYSIDTSSIASNAANPGGFVVGEKLALKGVLKTRGQRSPFTFPIDLPKEYFFLYARNTGTSALNSISVRSATVRTEGLTIANDGTVVALGYHLAADSVFVGARPLDTTKKPIMVAAPLPKDTLNRSVLLVLP